jgi:O-antigen ligase
MRAGKIIAFLMGLIFTFAALAKGAHDIWAGTLVYLAIFMLATVYVVLSALGRLEKIKLPMLTPLLVFFGAMALSFVRASNPSEAFLSLMNIVSAMLLFLLSVNVFRSSEEVESFLMPLVPCLWIQALLVIGAVVATRHQDAASALIAAHPALTYFFPVPDVFYQEKMGSLINANLFSVFLLPLTVLTGAQAWRTGFASAGRAFYWTSGFVAAMLSLVMAQSSSAWLALMLAAALLAALYYGRDWLRRNKTFVVAALILLIGVVVAVVAHKLLHNIDRSVDPLRDNANRLYWWGSALKMFLDHPWTGVGIGNFGSAYLTYKLGGTENTLFAHGLPFTLAAETGLLGSFSFLWLVGHFGWRLRPGLTDRPDAHSYLLALGSVAVFYTINIGFEYLVNVGLMAVLAGMVATHFAALEWRPRHSVAIVTVALLISSFALVGAPFQASRAVRSGEIALAAGDLDAAEKAFQTAAELDSRGWESFAGLAQIAAQRGDFESAASYQQRAVERNRLHAPTRRQWVTYQRLER